MLPGSRDAAGLGGEGVVRPLPVHQDALRLHPLDLEHAVVVHVGDLPELALGTPMMAQKKSSFMALRTSTSQWWPYASHRTPTTLSADRPTKHGAHTVLMASARIAGVMPPEADWYTLPW